jgi:hypothetical protein
MHRRLDCLPSGCARSIPARLILKPRAPETPPHAGTGDRGAGKGADRSAPRKGQQTRVVVARVAVTRQGAPE